METWPSALPVSSRVDRELKEALKGWLWRFCLCVGVGLCSCAFIRSDVEIIFNYTPNVLLHLTEELVGESISRVVVFVCVLMRRGG